MKHKHLFTLILSALLLWVSIADAQFVVRTIYFQPQGTPDKTADIRKMMADVHDYFGREMQRLGYTFKTFRIEKDANDQIVIHTVRGKHATAHYRVSDTTYNAIKPELPAKFKTRNNIHIIFIGGMQRINNGILGIGVSFFGNVNGGVSLVVHFLFWMLFFLPISLF